VRVLYLIRHPRPSGGDATCYGSLDLPLAEPISFVLAQVRSRVPTVANVWSSPLQRCLKLAQAIDPEAQRHSGLQEMNFGEWEGRSWGEIGETALNAWAADVTGYTPPGGESAWQVLKRAQGALKEILVRGQDPLVLVTHAGVIRALVADALGLTGPEWLRVRPGYGQVVSLEWDGRGLLIPAATRQELGL